MNNKYLKLRLFQSTFLMLFFMGMSMTAFAQSGSGSDSSGGGGSCPCPCVSGGGSDSGSGSASGGSGGSDSSSGGISDPCNCCVPDEVCPTPSISSPTTSQTSPNGNFCSNVPVTFIAPNLGFPCLEYTWNFGNNASPSTFVGRGPVSVTFFSTGSRQISMTIDNNCQDNPGGGGTSGSDSGSDGSGGSNSSSDGGQSTGRVICPMGGGSSAGGSGSDSGSDGSGGSNSSSDGFANNGGNGESCVTCRRTAQITINIEDCNQNNGGMIGDMVWNDLDRDGVMDNSEPGVQGVTATLSKDNGQFIAQTTTDFFGKYKFNNVMPSMSYKVTFSNLPAGFSFTSMDQGGNEANDSDVDPNTGMTTPIFLSPGGMNLDQDAGLVQAPTNQGSIGDKVFADNDGDGVQDSGEPGIGGVTVKLQDSNGNTLQTTTTDGNGNYTFNNVPQGLYKVMFNTPNGFTITMPKQGGNDNTDSDVQNNQMTNPFFLGQGQTLTNIDAGYTPNQPNNNGSIGDKVFADNNNNGQQDGNEPGIGGVTVKLQDSNGNTLQTMTTNGSGNYSFTNLAAGTYKIMFNTPNGFTQSPANVGNDATDSDNQSNQMTDPFFLSQGENNNTVDAGFVPNQPNNGASVGDKVFVDNNGDGVQNGNEPGVSGVTVKLQDTNGNTLQTTTTDGNGNYNFSGLNQGLYKVMFNTPNGFAITMPKQGGNEATDSDVQNNQMTNPFFLGENQDRNDIDAGYVPSQPNNNASVGDKVFADNNSNGQQDGNEPGIGGVTVKLQDANGNTLQTTTTSGGGAYSFTGLASGTYKVMFNTPNGFTQSPADVGNDATDSDNQSNQMTNTFFLADGENNPTIDAGFVPDQPNNNGMIGDKVYSDNNNNGQQDGNEPGIGGVTVKLQDSNGNTLQTTTTDGNGNYQFTNVVQGSYKVMVNVPNGFTPSPMNIGNDNTDSDIGANGMTNVFFLSQGQNDPTIDAGLFPDGPTGGKASVGDMAFRDNNGNGIMDQGEPGVQGVYVQLNDGNGSFLKFTTTDQNGKYKFTDLDPGRYQLKLVGQPSDLIPSPQNEGSDDSQDSDINLLGFTDFFNLSAGENNLTLDAGFSPREAVPQNCTLNATVSNISCDGSTYSFDVTVNGSNAGDWGWDLPEAGIYTQPFGSTRRITGVSGSKTFVIVDHDIAGCETTITVNAPNGCNTGGGSGGTGTCSDINISSSNGQITISGLTAAIEITKIFDTNWNLVYECSGNCPSTVTQSVGNGVHHVQVQFYTAQWGFICEKQEDVNVGAGGNNGGGNNGGGNNGGGNNGGGNSSGGNCDDINVQAGNGQISVSGYSAPIAIVKIFNPDFSIAKECTGANCSGPITATGLGSGRYHIDIQLYTASWQSICNFTQDVQIGGNSLIAIPESNLLTNNLSPNLTVYPNPANEELFVNMSGFAGKQGVLQLYNQIGQVVQSISLDKIPETAVRINLDKFEGGLYYISAKLENGEVVTQKVIIE